MKKATKKKTTTTPPSGRVAKKKEKAQSPKMLTTGTYKKAKQKGKGVRTKTGKSMNVQQGPQTPDRKETKTSLAQSTPSTIPLHSTSASKRAVTPMSSLELKSPPKKMKSVQDAASTINFGDASMINWLSEKGICVALEHHGKDQSKLESFDLHEKVVLLCSYFKPNDTQSVFQGIC